MTEADVFNALKKSTYEVVYNEIMSYLYPQWTHYDLTPIINKHGWTDVGFYKEYDKRQYDRR
jgi:hypothetical protein